MNLKMSFLSSFRGFSQSYVDLMLHSLLYLEVSVCVICSYKLRNPFLIDQDVLRELKSCLTSDEAFHFAVSVSIISQCKRKSIFSIDSGKIEFFNSTQQCPQNSIGMLANLHSCSMLEKFIVFS